MSQAEIAPYNTLKASNSPGGRPSTGSGFRQHNKCPRIGLISPYTGGNLGDAAIIESARKQLVSLLGDTEFILLVLNPAHVRDIHRLETFHLSALPREFYTKPPKASRGNADAELSSSQGNVRSLRHCARATLKRIGGKIPLALPVAKRIRDGLQGFALEARHIVDARQVVRSLDALLVAGGGQFDDEFGGSWGHPYAMYKWVRLAHSQRVPVFLAGVGMEDLRRRLSGWFLRRTLALARRVSLRDQGSIATLRKLGIKRELVLCADLAFGLLHPADDPALEGARSASHFTIGLSPIAFDRPGSWPTSREGSFDRYWREFQAFTASLLDDNHFIRIFVTDEPDYLLAQMLYDQLVASGTCRDRIQLLPKLKLPDILAVLPSFDAVVASRLHGVLLSHISRVPVLAISYRRKVSSQMEAMGHRQLCLQFETFTASEARQCLNALLADRGRLASELGRTCTDRYEVVAKEFSAICTELVLNPDHRTEPHVRTV